MAEAPAARRGRRSPLDHHNLRRTDWRVLLPVPHEGFEHMILLGGRQGLSDVSLDTHPQTLSRFSEMQTLVVKLPLPTFSREERSTGKWSIAMLRGGG